MSVDNRNNLPYHSRWASETEIKSSLHKIDIKDSKHDAGGIPLFADSKTVYIDQTDTHSMIVGSTGSKKTRLIGMPVLQIFARSGESFIATDPKGELYEKTLPLLKELNYNVFVVNLRDPKKSNGWNPLLFPYKMYKSGNSNRAIELVLDMSDCIMRDSMSERDPYWHNSAGNLLSGLIITLFECGAENEIHFRSLRAMRGQALKNDNDSPHSSRDYTPPYIKEKFLEHLDKNVFVFSLLNGSIDAPDTTRECIISVFDQAMRPFFCQDELVEMLSNNDFDMAVIGKEKTAVFLVIPDENTLYYRLISVFIKQCYTVLIQEAQKHTSKKLPVRVNFLLDEFSSLPPISDFPVMITASRSRNIRFNLIVQSINQLFRRYGNDAETIRGNCENWIFLHSREISLLEELISLSGMKNNDQTLLSMSILQTLDKNKGEAVVFHKRLNPFIANLLDIDEYFQQIRHKEQIEYPVLKQQIQAVFDFENFCKHKSNYFISQLFNGKKMTEEEYCMPLKSLIMEPVFCGKADDDDESDDNDDDDDRMITLEE